MPKSRFTHRAVASVPAHAVWQRLQDAATWAAIGPVEEVWDPHHDDAGSLRSYRWKTVVGPRAYLGSATVVASEPERRMELRLDGSEVVGDLIAELAPDGDTTTTLTVTLAIESVGVLSTLFFPVVADAVGRGLPAQVDGFVRSLDATD
ncbi:MAG: SRPBCC family protein [Acidimicrobiia bacterium]|jgi:carbon monoxide dehydrogenase subunit G